jgi:hypothetical protein
MHDIYCLITLSSLEDQCRPHPHTIYNNDDDEDPSIKHIIGTFITKGL